MVWWFFISLSVKKKAHSPKDVYNKGVGNKKKDSL